MKVSVPIQSWTPMKKYMAAHYYLSNKKDLFLTEKQKSRFSALHMQLIYGRYIDSTDLPEYRNWSGQEIDRRRIEWKNVLDYSKTGVISKFLSILDSLCPNWMQFPQLYDEFELDWAENHQKDSLTSSAKASEVPPLNEISSHSSAHQNPLQVMSVPLDVQRVLRRGGINFNPTGYRKTKKEIDLRQYGLGGSKSQTNRLPSISDISDTKHAVKSAMQQSKLKLDLTDSNHGQSASVIRTHKEPIPSIYNQRSSSVSLMRTIGALKTDSSKPWMKRPDKAMDIRRSMELCMANNESNFDSRSSEFLEQAIQNGDASLLTKIYRPKFDVLLKALNDTSTSLAKKQKNWSVLINDIANEFNSGLEVIFDQLETISTKYQGSQIKDDSLQTTLLALNKGIVAVKEVYDPNNEKWGMFGMTKMTKEAYEHDFKEVKHYFTGLENEGFTALEQIHAIVKRYKDKWAKLSSKLKLLQQTDDQTNIKIQAIQENAYKDNIELSNFVKNMKKGVGIAFGTKFESRIEELECENFQIKKELKELDAYLHPMVQKSMSLNPQRTRRGVSVTHMEPNTAI